MAEIYPIVSVGVKFEIVTGERVTLRCGFKLSEISLSSEIVYVLIKLKPYVMVLVSLNIGQKGLHFYESMDSVYLHKSMSYGFKCYHQFTVLY